MDIILTDSSLRKFLETSASAQEIAQKVSLCGPTFDGFHEVDGDFIYEIEAITNRIDSASAQGVAREAAAILTQFKVPAQLINDPYQDKIKFPPGLPQPFHFNFDQNLVVRFAAISLENISIKPSPLATQKFLENCGQKPLNNCIDITNELTILYGLPSHIFDLDKLATQNLTIRESRSGEIITTLDHQANQLSGGDLVIEDASGRLVDLCGIMGGQVAMVDDHTKSLLLIVPVYHPAKIRHSSLYLQKRTLAAQIYEKSPDPELCLAVMSKAIQLIKERAGGDISSSLLDYYPSPYKPKSVSLDFNWLNHFIGIDIDNKTVISILESLGFSVDVSATQLSCLVPSWRYHDINLKEDLAEEVARIYGYYRLPSRIPTVTVQPEPKNLLLETELKIKKYLACHGLYEVYNSSLISQSLIDKTLQSSAQNLKLKNALSLDYQYLRHSLIPSSLENHKHNRGKVSGLIKTFEVAHTYQKVVNGQLPHELSTLAILCEGNFLDYKGLLETLFTFLQVRKIDFESAQNPPLYFDPASTATVTSDGLLLGYLGLPKKQVLRNIGLESSPTAIEINLENLVSRINPHPVYEPVSEYPNLLEDITIKSKYLLGDIIKIIKNTSDLIKEVQYLGSYQQNHSFRVSFGSYQKNLQQSEVNTLKKSIQQIFQT